MLDVVLQAAKEAFDRLEQRLRLLVEPVELELKPQLGHDGRRRPGVSPQGEVHRAGEPLAEVEHPELGQGLVHRHLVDQIHMGRRFVWSERSAGNRRTSVSTSAARSADGSTITQLRV